MVIDELGVLQDRDRALVNGVRSSTSACNGRQLHLTIDGDGPFVPELRDDPAICVSHYAPADDCDLKDEGAWRPANPGLGAIASTDYMRDRVRLAAPNRADADDFRRMI